MRAAIAIPLCVQLGLLAGCANSERYYGNVYEGLKTREAIAHPSVEQNLYQKAGGLVDSIFDYAVDSAISILINTAKHTLDKFLSGRPSLQ